MLLPMPRNVPEQTLDRSASTTAPLAPIHPYPADRICSRNRRHIALRSGDVVVTAAHASSALWMQDIAGRLLRNRLHGQRRPMTSYLPLDGLPFRDDLSGQPGQTSREPVQDRALAGLTG
jgi:hypothetical protein